jgi:hypothetical protein
LQRQRLERFQGFAMIFNDRQSNTLLGVGIFVVFLLLLAFVGVLGSSNPGEIAGALGNVLGGSIGAAGAAVAVYLTLAGQRTEDSERVRNAITREIIEFTRIIMGILKLCDDIRTGSLKIPKDHLSDFLQLPQPIIYPAVAAQISLLRTPQQVVGFYMQMMSVKHTADIISLSPFSIGGVLEGDDVKVVVDPLAKACQLAKLIISDPQDHDWFGDAMEEQIVSHIDEALKEAARNFQLNWEPF